MLGLRNGARIAKYIRENKPTRSYRVSGRLGEATEGGFIGQKVIEKSTWRHIKLGHIEKLLATMQASHQKEMFKYVKFIFYLFLITYLVYVEWIFSLKRPTNWLLKGLLGPVIQKYPFYMV